MIAQEPSEIDGWDLIESKHEPKMFEGDQIPEKVVSAIKGNSTEETNDEEISSDNETETGEGD